MMNLKKKIPLVLSVIVLVVMIICLVILLQEKHTIVANEENLYEPA